MTSSSRSVFVLALVLVPSAAACSSDSENTRGRRIALETRITAGNEATAPFVNARGWSVTLTKLVVSVGPLYYFDGSPILSFRAPAKTPREQIETFFGLKTAWAHPGHYVPGQARGQMLTPSAVDLRGGVVALARGEGVTGVVRSATFSFHAPPTGPLASELAGRVAIVEGTAQKDADVRAFRAELEASELTRIEGCPFDEVTMDADGTVTVTVKPAAWLGQVDFAELPPTPDGKPAVMPATSIARNQLVRGMRGGEAYRFTYSTP